MTDSQSTRVQEETQSTDLEVARDFLAEAYAGQQWSADQTRQPFSFRYTAVGDQAMTLRTIRFDGHLDGVMTPSKDFVVQWTNKGRGTITTDSATIEMEHGRPQLWPQQGAAFSYDDYDQRIVQINRTALETVAGERGIAAANLQLDHTIRPDDRALQVWRSSVQLISHTVMDRHASPLLQAEMGRLGALALLELYPVASAALPDELLLPRTAISASRSSTSTNTRTCRSRPTMSPRSRTSASARCSTRSAGSSRSARTPTSAGCGSTGSATLCSPATRPRRASAMSRSTGGSRTPAGSPPPTPTSTVSTRATPSAAPDRTTHDERPHPKR